MANSFLDLLCNANKIAIIRTDRIGDMVLTMPMFTILKNINPNAEYYLITKSYVKDLVESCLPGVNIIYTDLLNSPRDAFKDNFDVVFNPRPRFEEALHQFISQVPLRIGSSGRLYSLLFNKRINLSRKSATMHEAEYNAKMISSITGSHYTPKLIKPNISDKWNEKIDKILNKHNIKEEFIIIHPGSGGSSCDLPLSKLSYFAVKLIENYGMRAVITGTQSELDICREINEKVSNSINLCGELSLGDMISLTAKAKILVANSTGAIHLAAANDIKVVGFYPNSPHLSAKRWGPYTDKKITISPPNTQDKSKDDMNTINIDEAVKQVEEEWGEKP